MQRPLFPAQTFPTLIERLVIRAIAFVLAALALVRHLPYDRRVGDELAVTIARPAALARYYQTLVYSDLHVFRS